MGTAVLICDDSSFARKQIARALPRDWPVDLAFAEHGGEALDAVVAGKADVLFLDLNMPVMDGYEVLQQIHAQDLSTLVIVVSGDIQPEAYDRVMSLGALGFIKKPVDPNVLLELLDRFGLRTNSGEQQESVELKVELLDVYREIANVAMGRAGDRLARLLDVFVTLPVPRVTVIDGNDLSMTFQHVAEGNAVAAVCQGFIGAGIAGEALLSFNESSIFDIAELMHFDGDLDAAAELELIMDVASLLSGACLSGIAEQLDIEFSQGHPQVLGRHIGINEVLQRNALRWNRILAIEFSYTIEERNFNCDLILLITEDSMPALEARAQYMESAL